MIGHMGQATLSVTLAILFSSVAFGGQEAISTNGAAKDHSVFYPPGLIERAKSNAGAHAWAKAMQQEVLDRAAPWMALSNDDLWHAMFGPNIPRTWMVWSDGYCPACEEDVRMYTWEVDPFAFPWKVRCPHCKTLFPTNDFQAFHESGQDEHGIFQPELADRSLVFNAEHPDPNDPLHLFGVDDGTGYQADGHRWRFIGWYVIFGQWKKWVHASIVNLSAAYAVTGNPEYAFKAAIMLDRVADVFPSFDFHTQGGLVYETTNGTRGQISTWHDACEEVRELALAYDRIYDGARAQETALTAYLSDKARGYKLDNPKTSWADIQHNIEDGIFRDTLAHRDRIESNYPRTDVALLVIKTVLDWPQNRGEVLGLLGGIVDKATAVDGMSGEKGLAGYTTIAPRAVAEILSQMARLEPDFLASAFERYPLLRQTYRFHLDTWCMESWYPRIGDTGVIGQKNEEYMGVAVSQNPGVEPSMYSFLMDVSKLSDDPGLVQVIYLANGKSVAGLPYDLFAEDPVVFQQEVQSVIEREGPVPKLGSVNKPNWHLAILRSGEGEDRRALWLDYDSGERHSHRDGMNIGLFAKGLDLIPDFGYPPVGYGGWDAPRAVWYTMTAAHNTVAMDRHNQAATEGELTLWVDGGRFHAMRASGPAIVGGERYERTVALADLDDSNFYVIDVFRVTGGKTHTKFFHSSFGEVVATGLTLHDAPPYSQDTQMRGFRVDENPAPDWNVDWRIDDIYDYVQPETEIHLRYTDLTRGARAYLAEGWVDTGLFGGDSRWIPRILVERTGDAAPLESTFVSVVEPYEDTPSLAAIRRTDARDADGQPLPDDTAVVVLERGDSVHDVFLCTGGSSRQVEDPEHELLFEGEMALISLAENKVIYAAVCNARQIQTRERRYSFPPDLSFAEFAIDGDTVRTITGGSDAVVSEDL